MRSSWMAAVVSIRWKDILEIVHVRRFAWKRFFAKMGVHSASLWFLIGIILMAYDRVLY
jgi:hypothetical protein